MKRSLLVLLALLLLPLFASAQVVSAQAARIEKTLMAACLDGQVLVKDTSQPYGAACSTSPSVGAVIAPAANLNIQLDNSCQHSVIISEQTGAPGGNFLAYECGGLTVVDTAASNGLPEINILGMGATPILLHGYAHGTYTTPTKSVIGDSLGDQIYIGYAGSNIWRPFGNTTVIATVDGDAVGSSSGAYMRFIFDEVRFSGTLTLENGQQLHGFTTSGHTWTMGVYDNDTGPAYVPWATMTNGNTPSVVIAAPAGGTTLMVGGLDLSTNVTPASSGTRFLCISTAGVVTSSASVCSGT